MTRSTHSLLSGRDGAQSGAATEADNRRRWDGTSPGHYEVWYLTCNHRPSRTGYWIRYTLESPLPGHGDPYCQLWFAHFDRGDPRRNFAINHRLPIAAMGAADAPFAITLGDARLTHDSMSGVLVGGGHEARWDLRWLPALVTHHHLPDVMYQRGGLGETTVLSPNLSVPVSGEIEVDGRLHAMVAEPGGQTHLWGRRHAHQWAWGHCNAFEGRPRAAFEALTVRLERLGVVLPPLTIAALHLDGELLAFNQFRHTLRNRGTMGTGSYRLDAEGPLARLHAEFTCRPEDMVVAEYADPDGAPSYCANTEVGTLDLLVERRGLTGWREAARLHSPFGGHFEVGARVRDPAIARDHRTVPAP